MPTRKVKAVCPFCYEKGINKKEQELEYLGLQIKEEKQEHKYRCPQGHEPNLFEVFDFSQRLKEGLEIKLEGGDKNG